MKAVLWLRIMVLMQISRLRFKQSIISLLIPHMYVMGFFCTFFVILIWRFLKRLEQFMEIGNFESLVVF